MLFNLFKLADLPFEFDAFQPKLSKTAFEVHYNEHHKTYVTNINNLTKEIELPDENINILLPKLYNSSKPLYNNIAQHWNHTFFWASISPVKKEIPSEIAAKLEKTFGSIKEFENRFHEAGTKLFGSGWVWLVYNHETDTIEILPTSNADGPWLSKQKLTPLLVCDVWEHAYYIDYRSKRTDFLRIIIETLNWEHASKQIQLG